MSASVSATDTLTGDTGATVEPWVIHTLLSEARTSRRGTLEAASFVGDLLASGLVAVSASGASADSADAGSGVGAVGSVGTRNTLARVAGATIESWVIYSLLAEAGARRRGALESRGFIGDLLSRGLVGVAVAGARGAGGGAVASACAGSGSSTSGGGVNAASARGAGAGVGGGDALVAGASVGVVLVTDVELVLDLLSKRLLRGVGVLRR